MTEVCSANLWTVDRFSPLVIDSVVAAVNAIGERYPDAKLTLIGYSGGGVIAMMAALQLERVSTVVTVASPLDTAAWTNEHGYSPLAADSNPADVAHWPERLRQIHFVGLQDDNVDAALMTKFLADIPPSSDITAISFPEFDHSCCWLEAWPDILRDHGLN
jgi:pimeloyl-ACP methyl ester carboxylesterase